MRFCLVFMAALLCGAAGLGAADYEHEESGLTFTLPKGWKIKQKNDGFEIENKEKTVYCVGGVIPKESAKAIFADIETFLDDLDGLEDVEVADGPKKEKVNGLMQSWYEGTGTLTDDNGIEHSVEWDMTIVLGGKGILFLLCIGELEENEKASEKFFQSIRRSRSSEAE